MICNSSPRFRFCNRRTGWLSRCSLIDRVHFIELTKMLKRFRKLGLARQLASDVAALVMGFGRIAKPAAASCSRPAASAKSAVFAAVAPARWVCCDAPLVSTLLCFPHQSLRQKLINAVKIWRLRTQQAAYQTKQRQSQPGLPSTRTCEQGNP